MLASNQQWSYHLLMPYLIKQRLLLKEGICSEAQDLTCCYKMKLPTVTLTSYFPEMPVLGTNFPLLLYSICIFLRISVAGMDCQINRWVEDMWRKYRETLMAGTLMGHLLWIARTHSWVSRGQFTYCLTHTVIWQNWLSREHSLSVDSLGCLENTHCLLAALVVWRTLTIYWQP